MPDLARTALHLIHTARDEHRSALLQLQREAYAQLSATCQQLLITKPDPRTWTAAEHNTFLRWEHTQAPEDTRSETPVSEPVRDDKIPF